jgi:hypothetical protein
MATMANAIKDLYYLASANRRAIMTQVFIPLSFDPGEAFQFDWSHEWLQMSGMPVKAKVAHIRLVLDC